MTAGCCEHRAAGRTGAAAAGWTRRRTAASPGLSAALLGARRRGGCSQADKGRGRKAAHPPAPRAAERPAKKPTKAVGRCEHRAARTTTTNTGDQTRRRAAEPSRHPATSTERPERRRRTRATRRDGAQRQKSRLSVRVFRPALSRFVLKKRKNHGRGRACCCCVRAFFVYLSRVFFSFFAMVKLVRPALCRKIRMAQLQAAAPVKVIEPAVEPVEPVKKPKKAKSNS